MLKSLGSNLYQSIQLTISKFISYFPKILLFIILMILGWIVAKIISYFLYHLSLRLSKRFSRKTSITEELPAYKHIPTIIKIFSFWSIILLFLIISVEALGLPAISKVLHWFAIYLPHLTSAFILILIGVWSGKLTSNFIIKYASTKTTIKHPEIISEFIKWSIIFISFLISLEQVGIKSSLINFIATIL